MRGERRVASAFVRAHPDDAARVLGTLPRDEASALLVELPRRDAAQALERMDAVSAAGCVAVMDVETAAEMLGSLPATAIAAILRQVSDAERLIAALPEPLRDPVARLQRFPPGTAGALADRTMLAAPHDITVGEAQKLLRQSPERASSDLYVVDRRDRLVGVLDLATLLGSPPGEPLASIMQSDPPRLPARATLRDAATAAGWLDHDTLPVVDDAAILLGILRHRAVRRAAAEAVSGAGAFTPFVGLAELYWASFSRLLLGLGPEPQDTGEPAQNQEGTP